MRLDDHCLIQLDQLSSYLHLVVQLRCRGLHKHSSVSNNADLVTRFTLPPALIPCLANEVQQALLQSPIHRSATVVVS